MLKYSSILRANIPDLMSNDKAAKILILKRAVEYTQQLKMAEQKLLADLELEKQRKIILVERLHALLQESGDGVSF